MSPHISSRGLPQVTPKTQPTLGFHAPCPPCPVPAQNKSKGSLTHFQNRACDLGRAFLWSQAHVPPGWDISCLSRGFLLNSLARTLVALGRPLSLVFPVTMGGASLLLFTEAEAELEQDLVVLTEHMSFLIPTDICHHLIHT